MANSFRDTDKGWKALVARMEAAAKSQTLVSVGIHEEEDVQHGGSDETVLEIAEKHEFGIGVPRRSFIADWADEDEKEHKSQLSMMSKALVKGTIDSVEQGLDRLGLRWVGEVQVRIRKGIDPPNSPVTVARKGSSTPLIDSGQLWGSIRHKVSE